MGSKIKLVLVTVLVLSISVRGQVVNVKEDLKTVSEVDNNIEALVPQPEVVVEPTAATVEDAKPEENAIEVLPDVPQLEVKSGKYQLLDDTLTGGVALEPIAGVIDQNVGESEKQLLLDPSTTSTTNNEYGK